ncbi:uncharacterized protein LOC130902743 [Diorhabda carinulata]|uniref:uncharacterized protein LOC130902743 n=1 Tax=Diorhabda carinulata TaxID=1163345 RepID=UPI0025A09232|nr:uncharacterized protein LOC130902743 [Diorhabda carinulata]
MGNVLFGQRCDHPSDESIINLSDSCVDKLLKPPEERENVICKPTNIRIEDDKWMKKLRCKDELHSKSKGITLEDIEKLLITIEGKIGEIRHPNCSTEDLIACLKQNSRCIAKCEKYMNQFIDCIDTARIEAIKKSMILQKTEDTSVDCDISSEKTCPPDIINDQD